MKSYAKNIGLTILGGLGLVAATAIMGVMFESPPTRAEFNTLKATLTVNQANIKDDLKHLKDGQRSILNLIIEKRK